jgi:ABC-type uncharacterized transport system substrate-binding protein
MRCSISARAAEFLSGDRLPIWPVPEPWGLEMRLIEDHYEEFYRRAATYVDKILKGTKPGDLPVEQPTKFEFVINRATAKAQRQVDGLVVLRDAVLIANQARLLTLAANARLPAMYGIREFVDSGGLMSYGPSLVDMYRRAAYLVDKILRGARPADLPVEQATKFELVLNLKTAKALGLTIPQSLLQRADQVIE